MAVLLIMEVERVQTAQLPRAFSVCVFVNTYMFFTYGGCVLCSMHLWRWLLRSERLRLCELSYLYLRYKNVPRS